jgi:hypothetical protein
MKVAAITFLLFACTSVHALTFWDSLALIESGMDDEAVGSAGEVSRYQMMPNVWHNYSSSRAYDNPRVARSVAEKHLNWLTEQFTKVRGVPPTERDIVVMWKSGFSGYKAKQFNFNLVSALSRDRAERFLNLREWTE